MSVDTRPTVLVLGGGPDAERSVSLTSSRAVTDALYGLGTYKVNYQVIHRPTPEEIAAMAGDVVFPVLHGGWGEGGELQAILESQPQRPFIGCGSAAAALAMDKVATKMAAARAGVATPACAVLNIASTRCPLPLPVVVKPVHEGSSVGLHVCRTEEEWQAARLAVANDLAESRDEHPGRVYMVERMIAGRELTLGILERGGDLTALPIVEINPKTGVYDFHAKYERGDTVYRASPELPPGVVEAVEEAGLRVAQALGVRHLCRVDFMLADDGTPWLLELNTMPGFTPTSLLPKAAAAVGMDFAALCNHLVGLALAPARG